jgi:hypothetical protein
MPTARAGGVHTLDTFSTITRSHGRSLAARVLCGPGETMPSSQKRTGRPLGATTNVLGRARFVLSANGGVHALSRPGGGALNPRPAPHGNMAAPDAAAISRAYWYLDKGDWAAAARTVLQALDLSPRPDNTLVIAHYIALMASVAVVRRRYAEAVRLFEASAAALRSIDAELTPTDKEELDRYRETAEAAIGEDAAVDERRVGAELTRDEAVAAALRLRS